jgi:hypothetical protein
MIAQKIARHEQRRLCIRRPTTAVRDDTVAGVGDGVTVQPSCCTDGGSDESCCSWVAGLVAVLAAGEAEWRGTPLPAGAVWATRAARRLARTRRASSIGRAEWRRSEWWERSFDTPLPGAPNVRFRAPQTQEKVRTLGHVRRTQPLRPTNSSPYSLAR